MDDIFVYVVDLPTKINEMVTPCNDGYTVYLNARLSRERQIEAYKHAVYEHVENNDWEKGNVQNIERRAHDEDS